MRRSRGPGRTLAAALLMGGLLASLLGACNSATESPCDSDPSAPGCTSESPARILVDWPGGISFTCISIGCSQTVDLTVENGGGGFLVVSSVDLAPGHSDEFAEPVITESSAESPAGSDGAFPMPSKAAPYKVRKGQSFVIQLRYTPVDGTSEATSDATTLSIGWYDGKHTGAPSDLQTLTLRVQVRELGEASAKLLTEAVNFGYAQVGSDASATVRIQNASKNDNVLSLTKPFTITPADSPFSIGIGFNDSANRGDTLEVPLHFAPLEQGAYAATLSLGTNDPEHPVLSIPLLGTSMTSPSLGLVSPESGSVDFGTVRHSTTARQEVRVRNLGGTEATVTATVTSGADFGFALGSASAESQTIAVMDEARFDVTFTPNRGGSLSGQLRIESANSQGNATLEVPLVGFGSAPRAVASPLMVSFGAVAINTTAVRNLQVSNTGEGALVIQSIDFEAGSSSQVSLSNPLALPTTLQLGDPPLSLPLVVHGTNVGAVSGNLLIHSNSIAGEVLGVSFDGAVVTCEEACPLANASPSCGPDGTCAISGCDPSYHDADGAIGNGCECREEPDRTDGLAGHDYSDQCPGSHIVLGDECEDGLINQQVRSGTLHSSTDKDLFYIDAYDQTGGLNDAFYFKIIVTRWTEGMTICVTSGDTGQLGECSTESPSTYCQPTPTLNESIYPNGEGSILGGDDTRTVTVRVMWEHPEEANRCGFYALRFEASSPPCLR